MDTTDEFKQPPTQMENETTEEQTTNKRRKLDHHNQPQPPPPPVADDAWIDLSASSAATSMTQLVGAAASSILPNSNSSVASAASSRSRRPIKERHVFGDTKPKGPTTPAASPPTSGSKRSRHDENLSGKKAKKMPTSGGSHGRQQQPTINPRHAHLSGGKKVNPALLKPATEIAPVGRRKRSIKDVPDVMAKIRSGPNSRASTPLNKPPTPSNSTGALNHVTGPSSSSSSAPRSTTPPNPTNPTTPGFSALFSSATYNIRRDPLAAAAAVAMSGNLDLSTLRSRSTPTIDEDTAFSLPPRPDLTQDGDETEDDEDLMMDDAGEIGEDDERESMMEDDEDENEVDELDEEEDYEDDDVDEMEDESFAESKHSASTSITLSAPKEPFSFYPLNHKPWMSTFFQSSTLPLGASESTAGSRSFAAVSLEHALISPAFRHTCHAQFAYTPLESWFLRGYDASNSPDSILGRQYGPPDGFIRLLATQMGVEPKVLPERMTRREWNVARRMLGAPRRFSAAFLKEERTRLHSAITHARQIQFQHLLATEQSKKRLTQGSGRNGVKGRKDLPTTGASVIDLVHDLDSDEFPAPPLLTTGSSVLAPHPRGQLALGIIIEPRTQHDAVSYVVRFPDQSRGSTSTISDLEILLPPALAQQKVIQTPAELLQLELLRTTAATSSNRFKSNPAPFLHTESDLVLLARLLQLVDRKKLLLDQLRIQNDAFKRLKSHPTVAMMNDNHSDSGASVISERPTNMMNGHTTLGTVNSTMEMDSSVRSATLHRPLINQNAFGGASITTLSPVIGPTTAPTIQLTPAQFAAAYQLFQRQYAWVVLQLETTTQNLEAALTQLRLRRSSARRSTALLLGAGRGSVHDPAVRALLRSHQREIDGPESLSHLQQEGELILKTALKEMMAMRIITKSSPLVAETTETPIQALMARCLTLVILIQRCVDEDRTSSAEQLNTILQSIRPKYKEHLPAYESICRSCTRIHEHLVQRQQIARTTVKREPV